MFFGFTQIPFIKFNPITISFFNVFTTLIFTADLWLYLLIVSLTLLLQISSFRSSKIHMLLYIFSDHYTEFWEIKIYFLLGVSNYNPPLPEAYHFWILITRVHPLNFFSMDLMVSATLMCWLNGFSQFSFGNGMLVGKCGRLFIYEISVFVTFLLSNK